MMTFWTWCKRIFLIAIGLVAGAVASHFFWPQQMTPEDTKRMKASVDLEGFAAFSCGKDEEKLLVVENLRECGFEKNCRVMKVIAAGSAGEERAIQTEKDFAYGSPICVRNERVQMQLATVKEGRKP